MRKRTLSLLLALTLAVGVLAVPAAAADFAIPGNQYILASSEPTGTTAYSGCTVYIYPEGTEFTLANIPSFPCDLTAYDTDKVGTVNFGPNYEFYSAVDPLPFVPQAGVIYHLVASDTMTGFESYILIEGSATTTPTEPAEPTDPAEPTEPAEPEDPSEPTEPAEPEEPAEQPAEWAAEQVSAGIELGIVPESLQSAYAQATTRAEFCALATGLYETVTGSEITDRMTFTDTEDENVEKMAALGVVNGVGENRFDPDASLTRQEAATMLARLAAALEKPLPAQASTFADTDSVASWALEAVGQMQASGVMNGTGNDMFSPGDPYERQQSIVTIMRLYELVK